MNSNQIKVPSSTKVASHTAGWADHNATVFMNVASANDFTIPLHATVPFPIGTQIEVITIGTGQTTIVATGGVTFYNTSTTHKLRAQYSGCVVKKVADNVWHLVGDFESADTPVFNLFVQALTSTLVASVTRYFGNLPKAPVTAAATSKIYVRRACTIVAAEIYCYAGTAGTAESWSLSIRKNNSSDTLIAAVAAATNERIFSNTALGIAMAANDYFEIKSVHPAWVTAPATAILAGYIQCRG